MFASPTSRGRYAYRERHHDCNDPAENGVNKPDLELAKPSVFLNQQKRFYLLRIKPESQFVKCRGRA